MGFGDGVGRANAFFDARGLTVGNSRCPICNTVVPWTVSEEPVTLCSVTGFALACTGCGFVRIRSAAELERLADEWVR